MNETLLDRAIEYVAPAWGLRRTRARAVADLMKRHYEAATAGRRTGGWRAPTGDANAMVGPALTKLRAVARDLERNNAHAAAVLDAIEDKVVGWGIIPKPLPKNAAAAETWRRWAETTDCDSDGRRNFYGLQKLVLRRVAADGEVLIRRRVRLPGEGLPIPMQLQVLDADYLDQDKNLTERDDQRRIVRRIVQGVEFDMLGHRVAYWLHGEHPGAVDGSGAILGGGSTSRRIPAESILHVYRQDRPGQVRGASWFAPVLLKLKDFDEYSDAQLMKQKIAACLSVIVTDMDGSGLALGAADANNFDQLEPGAVLNRPMGSDVTVVSPPQVNGYGEFAEVTLREIATGLGVSYEDMTGDFSKVNFSSARMSRLRAQGRIEDWRWQMLIPQFCAPVWEWAMQAAGIMGLATEASASWTAPPLPMIEPDKEGLAHQRNIRSGLTTLREVLRERGYDPDEMLKEFADTNEQLDKLGLVLDCDPRKMTQAGQAQALPRPEPEDDPEGEEPDGDEEPEEEALAAAAEADAERGHRERMALIEVAGARARQPITLQVAAGAVAVDARTTVADGAVRVDASTLIEAGAMQAPPVTVTIAEGAIQSRVEHQMPMTFADVMHVAAPQGVKAEQVGDAE